MLWQTKKESIMYKYYVFAIISFLFILLVFTGCSDDSNPVAGDNTTHFEAIGLYLIESGDTIVSYIGGTVSGQIEVADSAETPLIYVKFLTDDGTVGTPQGPEHSLQLTVADTTVAEPETHQGEDWEFHIKGKIIGQTTLEISIFHNDHPDFVSRPIPIMVN
jgi:hypothetical protein